MSNVQGVFHAVGDKAQELSNATQEKIGNAGQAVKDTVYSGYEKVGCEEVKALIHLKLCDSGDPSSQWCRPGR